MASIEIRTRSKSNPCNLNIRFTNGRGVQAVSNSGILVNPKQWSNKMKGFTSQTPREVKDSIYPILDKLKSFIVERYNVSFNAGDVINSNWLKNVIADFHKRPLDEEDPSKFFVYFLKQYIEESPNRINPSTGKPIEHRTIQKYKTILKRIEDFEAISKIQLKISDVNLNFHSKYVSYLSKELKLSGTTIEKDISTIKGFVKEAKQLGYETSVEIENKKFTFKREATIDVYLNPTEIERIEKLDFSNNKRLDNARDLFLIGLWTALRVSDLMALGTKNIDLENKVIIVPNTQKTGVSVEIPMRSILIEIFKKRDGGLPKELSSQKFNEYIKEICQLAEINTLVSGAKKVNNRKIKGIYPKFELVSSHTCRRSFATNFYNSKLLSNKDIMAITGHKKEDVFLKYVKTSHAESVSNVKKVIDLI